MNSKSQRLGELHNSDVIGARRGREATNELMVVRARIRSVSGGTNRSKRTGEFADGRGGEKAPNGNLGILRAFREVGKDIWKERPGPGSRGREILNSMMRSTEEIRAKRREALELSSGEW